ncbi:MAG: thioredoxin family protein [candidate division KSB1 bacterium]|nr:thioredoxin family protein [candidate division KSB1 bacterium]
MKLNQAIQKKQNIIVEFFTDWSASSFMMSELLKQLQREYAARFKVFFINADESGPLCAQYRVQKIPTLVFIKQGQVVKILEGTASRSDMINLIEKLFLKKD